MNNIVSIKPNLHDEPKGPYEEIDERNMKEFAIFQRIRTDDVMEKVGQICDESVLSYINPDYYYGIFRIGMNDIRRATPEFVETQIKMAQEIDPENKTAPYQIYTNLLRSYENKITGLNKIKARRATVESLPEIDTDKLTLANNAYETLQLQLKEEMELLKIKPESITPDMIKNLVMQTRNSLLNPIEVAAEPIINAGEKVIDLVFEVAGVKRNDPPSFRLSQTNTNNMLEE